MFSFRRTYLSDVAMRVLPFLLAVILVVVLTTWLVRRVGHLEAQIELTNRTMEAQTVIHEGTLKAIEKLDVTKTQVIREVRYAQQQIEQAEGNSELVPGDVALAWAAGIDGLRDDARGADQGSTANLGD